MTEEMTGIPKSGISTELEKIFLLMSEDFHKELDSYKPAKMWSELLGIFESAFKTFGLNEIEDEIYNNYFAGLPEGDPAAYRVLGNMVYSWIEQYDTLELLKKIDTNLSTKPRYYTQLNDIPVPVAGVLPIRGRYHSIDSLFSIYDFYQIYKWVPEIATEPLRVLDIGAGWGRVGYAMMKVNPKLHYVVVDLPHALLISSTYLPRRLPDLTTEAYAETRERIYFDRDTFGEKNMWFLTPPLLERVQEKSIDVALNISSFSEMHTDVVNNYIRLIGSVARGGHLFLRNQRIGVASALADYAIPKDWQCLQMDVPPHEFSYYQSMHRIS